MSEGVQFEPAITVVGIAIRTSHAKAEEIGGLWQRFYSEGVGGQIPDRLERDVYSVYFDYEGDFTAPYSLLIGCAVRSDSSVPEGMKTVVLPAGSYERFDATGEQPQGVIAAWNTIWKAPLERRYEVDFERYGEDGTVAIYVGVQ